LCAERALELDEMLGDEHELVVIDNQDDLDEHLSDMNVCISSPFYPAYLTDDRIENAPELELSITAGVGSDHVDLDAALDSGLTVAECTGSNVVSVAEHTVMQILILLRSFLSGHEQATTGGWDLAEAGAHARDIEGKTIGIFGLGKIGERVAARLQPFDVDLVYNSSSRHEDAEDEFNMEFVELDELAQQCDIITIHAPLYEETEELFDADLLSQMDDDAYIVNTARGKIVDANALVDALESDELAGYAGDVWYPEPAPEDHPWRDMPNQAMTIHYSGMTLDAQQRIMEGTHEILSQYFGDGEIDEEYLIAQDGEIEDPSYA
jgi:formate dehydrogenase